MGWMSTGGSERGCQKAMLKFCGVVGHTSCRCIHFFSFSKILMDTQKMLALYDRRVAPKDQPEAIVT
jgi:hypothetical protein